jgi:5-hydroxyisourate hydrolase
VATGADHSTPTISTHVLDTERGVPAQGVHVTLYRLDVGPGGPIRMTQALTDGDGRIRDLLERPLTAGDYRLEFNLANERVSDSADRRFFRRLALELRVEDTKRSYHVPLLLSSFAMTTYRGS